MRIRPELCDVASESMIHGSCGALNNKAPYSMDKISTKHFFEGGIMLGI